MSIRVARSRRCVSVHRGHGLSWRVRADVHSDVKRALPTVPVVPPIRFPATRYGRRPTRNFRANGLRVMQAVVRTTSDRRLNRQSAMLISVQKAL